nr:hypothetical protein GCM10020063_001630 [Dactylosporangium thailandense]
MNVYPFIEAEQVGKHSVKRACELLKVSRSAYYARNERSTRELVDEQLTIKILEVHAASNGTYGAPRIHAELADAGLRHGRKRIARRMRAAGIWGKSPRRWQATTIPDLTAAARPDLIGRDFTVDPAAIDTRWCGDITYVNTWEGWLYLATVIDLASRRVVGWAVADHLKTDLVDAALTDALRRRRPRDGLIFHSDRGCQGEFNRSSQHLHRGGGRWVGTRSWSGCRKGRGGSGRRTGRCGRRCGRRVGLSRHARCSGSSGG